MSQLLYIPFLILLIAQLVNAKDLFSIDIEGLSKAARDEVVERGLVPLSEEPILIGINCYSASPEKSLRCSATMLVLIEDVCETNVLVSVKNDGSTKIIQYQSALSSDKCPMGTPLNLKPFTLPGMEDEG
ncbi:MAG: hypothetical protein IIB71_14125 [Proteobacteria bacterium]|nr:hypothetical protein [Pseudomonadota bacterium]